MTPSLPVTQQFTLRTVSSQPPYVKRPSRTWRRPDFARRSKTSVLASDSILLAVAVSLTLACTTDFGGFPAWRLGLGSIICALGWLPSVVYLRQANSPPVPLLPLTGLFYFAACGLPAFYDFGAGSVRDAWHIDPSVEALTTVIYALVALYAGYYLASATKLLRTTRPLSLPRAVPLRRLTNLMWVLLALHLGALIFRGLVIEAHLDEVFLPLGYFAYGMLLILWLRRLIGPIQKLVFAACTVMEVSTRFASGSIAIFYLFILFLVIVVWVERQTIPTVLVASSLALFALVNYAKTEYRALTWGNGLFADAGIARKAMLFAEITLRPLTDPGLEVSDSAIDALASRASVLAFLTHVINQTPNVVPYWRGETYASLAYKLIPRMVWPDKPSEVLGYEFSSRYGLRSPSDESTSFNVPWVVEMYANFGTTGVVAGMALVGLLFAWLEQKLNQRSMTALELMLGTTVLFDLFYQESNFSLMIGSKILFASLLYAVIRIALYQRRTASTGRDCRRAAERTRLPYVWNRWYCDR